MPGTGLLVHEKHFIAQRVCPAVAPSARAHRAFSKRNDFSSKIFNFSKTVINETFLFFIRLYGRMVLGKNSGGTDG